MTDTTTTHIDRDTPHAAEWLSELEQVPSKGIEHFVAEAKSAAEEYVRLGCTNVDLQPGDGTRYLMYLLNRYQHAAEAGDDLGGKGNTMLVALPLWANGGSAYILSDEGFHMPYYVAEKLRLDSHSAVIIAAFTTLFSAAVTDLRAR